ncbi:MAG TPA: hypothetical protein VFV87_14795 [Pirellulaceae bacterium]|nr:hypothetical protein [Pirellulaceae bacterium]
MSTAPSKIPVACPQCGKNLMVPASVAGKQGRCPACQHVFVIPAPPVFDEDDLEPIPDLAPLDNGPYAPLAADPFAPSAGNPFAGTTGGNNAMQPAQPQGYHPNYQATAQPQHALANQYMANAAASQQYDPYAAKKSDTDSDWGINAGIGGGLLLMIGAVVWFFVALLFFDVIFFYPPIMFIIGLVAFFRGIAGKFS